MQTPYLGSAMDLTSYNYNRSMVEYFHSCKSKKLHLLVAIFLSLRSFQRIVFSAQLKPSFRRQENNDLHKGVADKAVEARNEKVCP